MNVSERRFRAAAGPPKRDQACSAAVAPAASAPVEAAVVVRQARWKAALLAATGAGFVAMGVLLLRTDAPAWVAWSNIVFFGACALAGAAQVARPGRLVLAPSGLTMEMLWRRRSWAWADIDDFQVWRMNSTSLVVFEDRTASRTRLARLNRSLGAASASLPPNWRVKPEVLCDLLATFKARWG